MKYLKSKLLKDTSYYFLGAVLLKGITFFLIPLYTKEFSVSEYGTMEMLNTFVTVASIVLSFGFSQVIYMRFVHLGSHAKVSFIQKLNSLYFHISTPIFLILAFLLPPVLSGGYSSINILLSVFVVFYTYLNYYLNTVYTVMQMEGLSKMLTLNKIFYGIITILLNLFLILVLKLGFVSVFIANLVGIITCIFIAYKNNLLQNYLSFKKLENIKKQFSYHFRLSFPFVLTSLSYFALAGLDKIIVRVVLGEQKLGIYALAFKFSSIFEPLLIAPLLSAYTPFIFKKFAERKMAQQGAIVIPTIICFVTIIGFLITFLASFIIDDKFKEALLYVPYLSVGYAFILLAQVFATIIIFKGRTKMLLFNVTTSGIINLLLTTVLAHYYDMLGVCYSFVISNGIWFALTYFQSEKLKTAYDS